MKITVPPYLKRGDTIAITCPAGFMPEEHVKQCVVALEQEGYNVIIGKTLGGDSQNYFSAADDVRLGELQSFFDDSKVKAILCGRGGYGTGRIIDRLSFKKFVKRPKWIIGFSDITILHAHLYGKYGIASLHAPMASAFKDGGNEYTRSLLAALRGEKTGGRTTSGINKPGKAKARLAGGNLSILAHLCGTVSSVKTKGCILFLEDIGEYLYNIDRMLWQLKRNGMFDDIAGLVIGGFTDMKDTQRPFGKTIHDMITEITTGKDYPVCYQFPVSHEKENTALKIGVKYSLIVTPEQAVLSEC